MIRTLRSTVHMSQRSMEEQLLCLVGTVTNRTPHQARRDADVLIVQTVLLTTSS